jgi:phosphatidylserine decarboxylase
MVKSKLLWTLSSLVAVVVGIQWYLRNIWFFRDPQRQPPNVSNAIVSPADGQVVYIKQVKSGDVVSNKLGEKIPLPEITKYEVGSDSGWLIGIYMSPLDVHFNYAPLDGKVSVIRHYQARINLPMVDLWEYVRLTWLRQWVDLFGKKWHFENERSTIFLQSECGNVAVVEIADKFVNKIETFVKEGDQVKIGQKVSFIKRGSQVDLFIPKTDLVWHVKVGEHVSGAETILATW